MAPCHSTQHQPFEEICQTLNTCCLGKFKSNLSKSQPEMGWKWFRNLSTSESGAYPAVSLWPVIHISHVLGWQPSCRWLNLFEAFWKHYEPQSTTYTQHQHILHYSSTSHLQQKTVFFQYCIGTVSLHLRRSLGRSGQRDRNKASLSCGLRWCGSTGVLYNSGSSVWLKNRSWTTSSVKRRPGPMDSYVFRPNFLELAKSEGSTGRGKHESVDVVHPRPEVVCSQRPSCFAGQTDGWHMLGRYLRASNQTISTKEMLMMIWFFPTCQVRVVRFYVCSPPLSSSSPSPPPSSPRLRRHPRRLQHGAPDRSVQHRTSPGNSKLQCAAPDLTGELPSGVCSAGPHPGSSRADRAAPDLTRGAPERTVQRRTSAARRYVKRYVRRYVRKNVRRYVNRNVR